MARGETRSQQSTRMDGNQNQYNAHKYCFINRTCDIMLLHRTLVIGRKQNSKAERAARVWARMANFPRFFFFFYDFRVGYNILL